MKFGPKRSLGTRRIGIEFDWIELESYGVRIESYGVGIEFDWIEFQFDWIKFQNVQIFYGLGPIHQHVIAKYA